MSGTSARTVHTYERNGHLARAAAGKSRAGRLAAIRATLEAAGVVFTEKNGGGPRVRLRKPAGDA